MLIRSEQMNHQMNEPGIVLQILHGGKPIEEGRRSHITDTDPFTTIAMLIVDDREH